MIESRARRIERRVRVGAFVVLTALCIAVPMDVAHALKVNPSPTSMSLAEGSSQVLTVTLDAPIISPGPGPALVTLVFTVADPSRVSLSTSTLVWNASEWFQSRQLTVTALHDGVHNATDTVAVQGVVTSDAPYYDGFMISVSVTIADVDPEPTTTTTAAAPPTIQPPGEAEAAVVAPSRSTGLPETGVDLALVVAGALSVLAGGALLLVSRRIAS